MAGEIRLFSRLTTEQKKHLAGAVDKIALGQLAAFGYTALTANGGFPVIVASLVILVGHLE